MCPTAPAGIDETGTVISIRREPPDLASPDLSTRLRRVSGDEVGSRSTDFGAEIFARIGTPLPIWGSDVVLVWRALLVAPVETVAEPLGDYRVFRFKTADATLSGLTRRGISRSSSQYTNGTRTEKHPRASDCLLKIARLRLECSDAG